MAEKQLTPVEVAYAAWLRVAREKLGTGAAVVRAMQDRLTPADLSTVHNDWASKYGERDWRSSRYAQWEKGRKSVPTQPVIRAALIATIIETVFQPPVEARGFGTFAQLVDGLEDERRRKIASAGTDDAAQERKTQTRNYLVVEAAAARDLNGLELGLGSWAYDNELPLDLISPSSVAITIPHMVENAQVEETLMSRFDLFLYPKRFRAEISTDGTSWGGAKLFADAVDDFLGNRNGYLPVWGRSGIRAVLFDGSAGRWSLIDAAMKEVDTRWPAGISLCLRVARPRMKFIARVDWHGTVAFEVGAPIKADLEAFEKNAELAFHSRLINGRFGEISWRGPEKEHASKSDLAPESLIRATHSATPKIGAGYTASIPVAPSTDFKRRLRGWGGWASGIFGAIIAALIAGFILRFIG